MLRGHGIAHTTLTVSNIQKTKKFYEGLFDVELPMNKHSFSLQKVGIPCWFSQWRKRYKKDRFDERRIGLDHIAFKLETIEELEKIISRLKKMNIKTEGLQRFAKKYPYVCFRDPDNIQTEFFIPKVM